MQEIVEQGLELQQQLRKAAKEEKLNFEDGLSELKTFAASLVEANRAISLKLIESECSVQDLQSIIEALQVQTKLLNCTSHLADENLDSLYGWQNWLSRVLVIFAEASRLKTDSSAPIKDFQYLRGSFNNSAVMSCIGEKCNG